MGRPTLWQNRKFRKLAKRLGSTALARGHLELLWDSANETGNEIIGDSEDVELLAEWDGEAGALVDALMGCGAGDGPGFIIETEIGIYQIHDYWDHAPRYVRRRRQREDERKGDDGVTDPEPVNGRSVTGQQPPLPTPNSQHAHPTRTPKRESTPEFERWWQAYPKRVGRKRCLEKWKAISRPPIEEMLEKLEAQIEQDRNWREGFIPHPLTYLNGARWEDEIDTSPTDEEKAERARQLEARRELGYG